MLSTFSVNGIGLPFSRESFLRAWHSHNQQTKFLNAQLVFADTLEGPKPFVNDAVWQAFFDFENSIIMWKFGDMPKESVKESRDAALIVAPKKLGNGSPSCSSCNRYRSENACLRSPPAQR